MSCKTLLAIAVGATLLTAVPVGKAKATCSTCLDGPTVAITSANVTTFTVGTAGTFTVTVAPPGAVMIGLGGSLPSGVTFTNNFNGTATIAGTPASGTAGVYPFLLTANNGNPPEQNALQGFNLTVNPDPNPTPTPTSTITPTPTPTPTPDQGGGGGGGGGGGHGGGPDPYVAPIKKIVKKSGTVLGATSLGMNCQLLTSWQPYFVATFGRMPKPVEKTFWEYRLKRGDKITVKALVGAFLSAKQHGMTYDPKMPMPRLGKEVAKC